MFLTTVVFAVMSLFYKYANDKGSAAGNSTASTNESDDLHLTAASEPIATTEPSTESKH